MDNWQKALYKRLEEFVGDNGEKNCNADDVRLGMNPQEAYVLMKALEAQEKYENPLLVVENGS